MDLEWGAVVDAGAAPDGESLNVAPGSDLDRFFEELRRSGHVQDESMIDRLSSELRNCNVGSYAALAQFFDSNSHDDARNFL